MEPAPLVSVAHRLVEHPAGLLAGAASDGWLVVRCQPGAERAVTARLLAAGVPHLTVLATTLRRYSRSRSRSTTRGVLPGHWFVRWPAGHHDLYDRLRPAAVHLLPVPPGDGGRFLGELRDFVCVLLSGGHLAAPTLAVGDAVEVIAGTLAGCRGRILATDAAWSLRVELSLLGTTVSTAIDPGCVRRLEDGAA